MASTVGKEFGAAPLYDPGEVVIRHKWDGTYPTTGSAAAAFTMTFSNNKVLTGTAWIKGFVGEELQVDGDMEATTTFRMTDSFSVA